jgi:hypothetical protein
VPLILAPISFFLPMWAVHKEMLLERERLHRQLDQISRKIDHLGRKLLEEADEIEPATLDAMSKQIAAMRTTYRENERIPTWPFNTQILVKFVSSQTVPLLGLTGLGPPVIERISSVMSFLESA